MIQFLDLETNRFLSHYIYFYHQYNYSHLCLLMIPLAIVMQYF